MTSVVTNAAKIAAEIGEAPRAADAAVQAVVTKWGLTLLADVKRRAARPRTAPSVAGLGPRLQTGTYNESINVRFEHTRGSHTASVGSNAVQARRLELGFVAPGKRTLPHPHYAPALETVGPRFARDVDAIIAALHEARSIPGIARRFLP